MLGDVTDCSLHLSNGGNCLTILLDIPDTNKGATTLLTVNFPAFCNVSDPAFVKGAISLLPSNNSTGLTTTVLIPFAPNCATPIPNLLDNNGDKPYLYPSCVALPINGKPPPTVIPSIPYLILFLNSAPAFSLPLKLFVSSGLKNKDSLPGSDAKKSVAPTIAAPSTIRVAI